MSIDAILQRIQAGHVAVDALVCEVGGAEWVQGSSVPAFATAFARLRIDGPTMVDPLPEPASNVGLDGEEATTVNNLPLRQFDDTGDATVVEKPLLPTDRG
jgi:hypothetical protein